MAPEIAISTLSGKVYFLLVDELKRRHLQFISLKPGDTIPAGIRVVLTSQKERELFANTNVLGYVEGADPSALVDRAILVLLGKSSSHELIIGIDPGKTIGVAILVDGVVLRTARRSSVEEVLADISRFLTNFKNKKFVVRIGNGSTEYHRRIIGEVVENLPRDAIMELIDEKGTTRAQKKSSSSMSLDERAAIRIAQERGSPLRADKPWS